MIISQYIQDYFELKFNDVNLQSLRYKHSYFVLNSNVNWEEFERNLTQ